MRSEKLRKFNWRAFTSLYMTFSFIILLITGISLYIAPPGRVAFWVSWKWVLLDKEQWQAVHTVFSFLFVMFGLLHLYFNWKPLLAYLRNRISGATGIRRETLGSLTLTGLVFFLVVSDLPPVNYIMLWGEEFSNAWETLQSTPPVPHAEKLSLTEFAASLNISYEALEKRLLQEGVKVDSAQQIVLDVAGNNGLAPSQILELIDRSEPQAQFAAVRLGGGYGRKTVAQICDEFTVEPATALARLKAHGISAAVDEPVKELASEHNLLPVNLVEIIIDQKSIPHTSSEKS